MSEANRSPNSPDLSTATALLAEVTARTERVDEFGSPLVGWTFVERERRADRSDPVPEERNGSYGRADFMPEEGLVSDGHAEPTENGTNGTEAEAGDGEWAMRPWRERIQAADVAIAGLVLILALVTGLVFLLGQPSAVPGSKHLAFPKLPNPSTNSHREGSTSRSAAPSTASQGSSTSKATSTPSQTTSPSTPAAAVTPTTAPKTKESTPTTVAAAPPQCTPQDFTVSTATDSSSYWVGAPVTVTTKLIDTTTCVFDPTAAGQYGCPTTVIIQDQMGNQVFPQPGQSEQCAAVSGGTLKPGQSRSVKLMWNQDPPGEYTAVGTWAFGPPSSPYQYSASSQPFVVTLTGSAPSGP